MHPFLVLAAAAAVAMRIRQLFPAAALIGLFGFTLRRAADERESLPGATPR